MDPAIPAGALPLDWEAAIRAVEETPGVAIALGAPDCGKTTWVRAAADRLARSGRLPLAIVDADIGQATLGPPATASLGLIRDAVWEPVALERVPCVAYAFIGSVSPPGHLLPLLVAAMRLVKTACRAGAAAVLVDTDGLVAPGIGFQLKLRMIETLEPAYLIALQRGTELEPLLSVVGARSGLHVHRLAVARDARARTAAERAAYRAERLAAYFNGAGCTTVPARQVLVLDAPDRLRSSARPSDVLTDEALREGRAQGLLVGLNDADDETLALGVLEGIGGDGRVLEIRTPLRDVSKIRLIQLGSLALRESARQRGPCPGEASPVWSRRARFPERRR